MLNTIEIFLCAIIIVTLDALFLQTIKKQLIIQIQKVQCKPIEINIFGALMCYISIIFGFYYFIIRQNKSITDAFLLGLVIYSIFEFTNYSLLKDWSLLTVAVDSLWGGILFALTAFIIYKLKRMSIMK